MPDFTVVAVGAMLAGERMFAEWHHARERRYLVNAAIATTPAELKQLEAKPPRQPKKPREPIDGYTEPVGI